MNIFRLIHTSSASGYNTGAQLPTPPPDDISFARSNSHCDSNGDTEIEDMDMTFDMDLDEEEAVHNGDTGDKAGDVGRGDMRSPDSIPDPSKAGIHATSPGSMTTKLEEAEEEEEEEEKAVTIKRDLDQETRNEIMRNDIMPPDEMDPKAGTELLFDKIKILGTGTFSTVWLVSQKGCENEQPPQFYALKQLRKADVVRLKQVEHIRNEKSILAMCRDFGFITHFIEAWQDRSSLYILLEYSPGGEMFGYLRRAKRFELPVAQFYAAEITLILIFLHDNGIVYRDLKPENILFDERGHIKLVDFGFAKVVGDRETYTLCGTPEYLSPEVIHSKGHTKAVDWDLSSRFGNTSGGGWKVMEHPFFKEIDWEEVEQRRGLGPVVPHLEWEGDTRYFEEYEEQKGPDADEAYTERMRAEWDHVFADF
ncbi:Similar to cAMP-dependent protein kinase catalytic subunit; acc. no. P34099 [Pyronema omphalodes CBS 100304]|uniref:cAMP-dependent protein kinase n=1 Tax=Pyronema omphalodes (strain CBS 100304) TaxID=1076935 RepID=U4KW80_PYROM|nr:Similar to cAMP-dependent protein kinase catalytic subunit; acc. no. P34099 [Pyronema omphalodes CBS 100304]